MIDYQVVPPVRYEGTIDDMEHAFSVMHQITDRNPVILEIHADKQNGIKYIVRCSEEDGDSIKRLFQSLNKSFQVNPINIERKLPNQAYSVNLSNHFAYPIRTYSDVYSFDQLSYITGAMTELKDGQKIVIQMTVSSSYPKIVPKLLRAINRNEDISQITSSNLNNVNKILNILSSTSLAITDLVTSTVHGGSKSSYSNDASLIKDKTRISQGMKPARSISRFEMDEMALVSEKINRPLFQVSTNIYLFGEVSQERVNHLKASFSAFNNYELQKITFKKKRSSSYSDNHKDSIVLSTKELANLYHFPRFSKNTSENVDNLFSPELPAPVSLKNNPKIDVYIGLNTYHGVETPIGLTVKEREKHLFIIGGTGNGKTTMISYAIKQDINNGKGLALIDPHGDLAEDIVSSIPEHRKKDLIYINPDDYTKKLGINLLELPTNLSPIQLEREKDLITESIISVMRKVFSDDDTGGHRIEYVMRNSVQTALTVPDATLFTVYELLNNPDYRKTVVNKLEDVNLKTFWQQEFGKAGSYQKVKMSAGITAKIGRFLFSASAKRVLSQTTSTIDFDDAMNSNKIIICNYSKGLLGEDTSTLFGTMTLAKIQISALRRARTDPSLRVPFYVYVDEFQNFATTTFTQMLSEARKYKLFLTMAEQSTSQQDESRLVDVILANVGSVVAFRSGNPRDEQYILPLFEPYLNRGDISNLSSYHFYYRGVAESVNAPMSGVTLLN